MLPNKFFKLLLFFCLLFQFFWARKRNLHESQIHKIKLYGNSFLGYYYINLFVGSNFQRQTVIIDTGSSVTSFPCTTCQDSECGTHMDDHFNISNSNTSKKISCAAKIENYQCEACSQNNNFCTYNIDYAEGSSMNGYFVEDVVILGDELMELMRNKQIEHPIASSYIQNEKAKFVFGCTTKETNMIKSQQADGILGLGIESNTKRKIPNIIDYTFSSHHQEKLEFSLCLSRKEGGFMSIGGYNTDQHVNNETFIIPMSRSSAQYNIRVHNLKIDGEDMGLNLQDFEDNQGTFLDTGTTLFYAHFKIYKKIMDKMEDYCQYEGNCQGTQSNTKCYYWNKVNFPDVNDFLGTFPKMEFQMDNNFTFVWEPQNYFYSDDGLLYCLPFERMEGRVIFGAIFMRNYDVLFDRTDKEIHFTKADCEKNSNEIFLNLDKGKLMNMETPNFANETDNSTTIEEENIGQKDKNSSIINKTMGPEDIEREMMKNVGFSMENKKNEEEITVSSNFSVETNKSNNESENTEKNDQNNENLQHINESESHNQSDINNILNEMQNKENSSITDEKNSSFINTFQKSSDDENDGSFGKEHHLMIIFGVLGLIFLFGLVAFIIIKIKKYDINKKGFGRVQTSARESKENSQFQQPSTDLKASNLSNLKDVYSIEDPSEP